VDSVDSFYGKMGRACGVAALQPPPHQIGVAEWAKWILIILKLHFNR